MKRVLTFLAILLLPLSLWAMTPVSDSDLSNVTGQAGVNINADVTMDILIGTIAWGDNDGIKQGALNPWQTVAAGGYVGVNDFNITGLSIKARTETNDHYNGYSTLFLKPITIDVATGDATSPTWLNGRTFVRFGLGALQINMNAMSFEVALGARDGSVTDGTDDLGTLGLSQVMGTANIGAMEIYINPWSYVDIYAHEGQGVNFDLNVKLDRVAFGYMSWGDEDGLADAANVPYVGTSYWMNEGADMDGGYVGLGDFQIKPAANDAVHPAVAITGTVAIDVATSAHGTYADLEYLMTAILPLLDPGEIADEAAILNTLAADGIPTSNTSVGTIITGLNALGAGLVANGGTYEALGTFAALATNAGMGTFAVYGTFDAAFAQSVIDKGQEILNLDLSLDNVAAKSVVHISFPNQPFNVKVAKIVGNVALSSAVDVTAGGVSGSQILGDIYIQGIDLTIKQGSWVDIWAH